MDTVVAIISQKAGKVEKAKKADKAGKGVSFLSRLIFFILHYYGLYPHSQNTKYYWILSYIYHFFFSFTFCVCALIYAFLNITDQKKSTDAFSSTLTILAFILKMINYHFYRKQIMNFITKLFELQEFDSPAEIQVANEKRRFISGICYLFLACGHLTIFTGCFVSTSGKTYVTFTP